MDMRTYLNSLLAFIGSTALTDDEWAPITATVQQLDQASYNALSGVIQGREGISTMHDRLNGLYTAKGVDYIPAKGGTSNILIGLPL